MCISTGYLTQHQGALYISYRVLRREGSNNIICPELVLDIHPFILEDTLTANRYGHAYAFIRFPRPTPTGHGTFFMQAIDLEECEKSNLTEYDF